MPDWKPTLTTDPLVGFLYTLLRDAVTAGEMERIVREEEKIVSIGYFEVALSNPHIAAYALELANRLRVVWENHGKLQPPSKGKGAPPAAVPQP